MKKYPITEIFYSLQGEGARAGEPSVFVRFAGCNLSCKKETQGFDCDTKHPANEYLTAIEILAAIRKVAGACHWIVLTGGEPLLHIDAALVAELEDARYFLAAETNGTLRPPSMLDWITVSPKRRSKIIINHASEVKMVIAAGDPLPAAPLEADYYLLSPAFEGAILPAANLARCINLCLENPRWRLSVQQHKVPWGIR